MLSKKQMWRKTNEAVTSKHVGKENTLKKVPTPKSATDISENSPHIPIHKTELKSVLNSSSLKNKESKSLRFSPSVHVMLVPSRREQLSHFDEIFWHREDFAKFKRQAMSEISELSRMYRISPETARSWLYQPYATTAGLIVGAAKNGYEIDKFYGQSWSSIQEDLQEYRSYIGCSAAEAIHISPQDGHHSPVSIATVSF